MGVASAVLKPVQNVVREVAKATGIVPKPPKPAALPAPAPAAAAPKPVAAEPKPALKAEPPGQSIAEQKQQANREKAAVAANIRARSRRGFRSLLSPERQDGQVGLKSTLGG